MLAADLSCHITIHNATAEDLKLEDKGNAKGVDGGVSGSWPEKQPPEVIKAGSRQELLVKLGKDDKLCSGWVHYIQESSKKNLSVEFANSAYDALPSNIVGYSLKAPDFDFEITYEAREVNKPLRGTVKISKRTSKAVIGQSSSDMARPLNSFACSSSSDESFRANFKIGFGPVAPIHELMTVYALRAAGLLPPGTTYANLNGPEWEYMRGVNWNDDPSSLLFVNLPWTNSQGGLGIAWLTEYNGVPANSLTNRSHSLDMQCIHAMAPVAGQNIIVTRGNVLTWLGFLFDVARGTTGGATLLANALPGFFGPGQADPRGALTVNDLLRGSTPLNPHFNVQRRALGACLHIIQDSYALGHTRRTLLNPADLIPGWAPPQYVQFQAGHWGQWDSIREFHTYAGQNRHAWYDNVQGNPVPNDTILASFNPIIGARSAIAACMAFLQDFNNAGLQWAPPAGGGVRANLEATTFLVLPGDQNNVATNGVDVGPFEFDTVRHDESKPSTDIEYELGLQQKLAALDSGYSTSRSADSLLRRPSWRYVILFCLLALVLLAGAATSVACTWRSIRIG